MVGPGLLGLNFSNGYASSIGSNIVGSQQLFASTVIQADDTVVITKGAHTFHIGFQFFRERINVYYAGNNGNQGQIGFTGQYSGTGETDFLLGLPASYGGGSAQNGTWGQRSSIFAGFVQDDYHVTQGPHAEYRTAVRKPYALGGGGQPAGELRSVQRHGLSGRPELPVQQLPRPVQLLQRRL